MEPFLRSSRERNHLRMEPLFGSQITGTETRRTQSSPFACVRATLTHVASWGYNARTSYHVVSTSARERQYRDTTTRARKKAATKPTARPGIRDTGYVYPSARSWSDQVSFPSRSHHRPVYVGEFLHHRQFVPVRRGYGHGAAKATDDKRIRWGTRKQQWASVLITYYVYL